MAPAESSPGPCGAFRIPRIDVSPGAQQQKVFKRRDSQGGLGHGRIWYFWTAKSGKGLSDVWRDAPCTFLYESGLVFQAVDLMVVDTKGQHFLKRESTDKGKFAFTTDDYDVYEICFLSRVPPNVRGMRHEVFLSTKHGVEAKSYEGLGDANKLKPLEVELKRLEDLSESIVQVVLHDVK